MKKTNDSFGINFHALIPTMSHNYSIELFLMNGMMF